MTSVVKKNAYHFVDYDLGVKIFSKKERLIEKQLCKLFFLGGGQTTYLGEGKVCLGHAG